MTNGNVKLFIGNALVCHKSSLFRTRTVCQLHNPADMAASSGAAELYLSAGGHKSSSGYPMDPAVLCDRPSASSDGWATVFSGRCDSC